MKRSLYLVTVFALLSSACGGKEPYCCTLKAMSSNQSIAADTSERTAWSQMGSAGNEDVCKTEVERMLNSYEYSTEAALGQCADK